MCVCVHSHVLSTESKMGERERTHPVHSSGLPINAPIFTANIIEAAAAAAAATACAELLPNPREKEEGWLTLRRMPKLLAHKVAA